jgi:ribosomal protein S21
LLVNPRNFDSWIVLEVLKKIIDVTGFLNQRKETAYYMQSNIKVKKKKKKNAESIVYNNFNAN